MQSNIIFKSRRTRIWKPTTDVSMNKIHYQHFIKLDNRKKKQKVDDITAHGYTCVKVSMYDFSIAKGWCRKNLKEGTWVNLFNRFYFAYNKDATKFIMHI
jgi:hypothetical protein